jgi:hypothetical protein
MSFRLCLSIVSRWHYDFRELKCHFTIQAVAVGRVRLYDEWKEGIVTV